MKTPIHTFLSNYTGSGIIRCHMPGGKGRLNPLDITEIDGADNLYEADGIIRESEELASSLFGSGATLYSCGGSTLVIQAMLALLTELTPKRTIVAGRYSHKSLVNACILLGFDIKWAYPADFLSGAVTPSEIQSLIDSDTAGVFVTSIDYYGGECDIAAIASVCRERNVPLLVDNAHGAYRVFTKNHPIQLGADMCADSAHKTLPALTGAAYLHLKDGSLRDRAKRAMALFGTSSPSYPIMDSLDLCNPFIDGRLAAAVGSMHNIAVLKGWLSDSGFTLKKSDAMRITIDAAAYGYEGQDFAHLLRKAGAECEMADENYVVLLFSPYQNETDLMKLYKMLKTIPICVPLDVPPHEILRPKKRLAPREAYFSPKKTAPVDNALGKICAGVHSPCPPCVPIVMPGEVICEACLRELFRYEVKEVCVVDE